MSIKKLVNYAFCLFNTFLAEATKKLGEKLEIEFKIRKTMKKRKEERKGERIKGDAKIRIKIKKKS